MIILQQLEFRDNQLIICLVKYHAEDPLLNELENLKMIIGRTC